MTAQVHQIDPSAHAVVDALLPWYVNGALKSDEREVVRAHLDKCPACREEEAWLRQLHASCAAVDSGSDAANPLRNLRRHLESGRPGPSATLAGAWRQTNAWARLGVAASLASMAVVMTAALWNAQNPPSLYRTLAASGASTHSGGSVVVRFDPSTPERELRRILRATGARLLDGPTQTDAYILDVPPGQRASAVRELRKEQAVVLVEQLAPENTP
jgi:anti-sigma-K factor RskA